MASLMFVVCVFCFWFVELCGCSCFLVFVLVVDICLVGWILVLGLLVFCILAFVCRESVLGLRLLWFCLSLFSSFAFVCCLWFVTCLTCVNFVVLLVLPLLKLVW